MSAYTRNRVLGSDSFKRRAEHEFSLTELRLISDQSTVAPMCVTGWACDAISGAVMAVDLTPRFRRLNSQNCFRENKQLSGTNRWLYDARMFIYLKCILLVNCTFPLVYELRQMNHDPYQVFQLSSFVLLCFTLFIMFYL